MPKVLGFIPCRSGSKRIIDKNLSIFNSKILIQNTYDLAESSNSIDNIVISTDSFKYLEKIEKKQKYIDIGLRSKSLALDHSTDLDVIKEVICKLNNMGIEFEYIVHLRPTYPSLSKELIDDAFQYFESNKTATSLKSVEKLDLLYQKCLIEDDSDPNKLIGLDKDTSNENSSLPSQLCKNIYAQTAAIDIYKTEFIFKNQLWGDYCLKYELGMEAADIDEYYDFPSAYSAFDQLNLIKSAIKENKRIEICFDIDGVLFSRTFDGNYENATPNKGIISFVKTLKEKGFVIILHTARGTKTGIDWKEITKKPLLDHNIPYDKLVFNKPGSDFYVDDRGISIKLLKKIVQDKF